jgi:hypothetical protein
MGDRHGPLAGRCDEVEVPSEQRGVIAAARTKSPLRCRIAPFAFAIDGAAGRQQDLLGTTMVPIKCLKHRSRARHVDMRVPGGEVEGLAGAGFGGKVNNLPGPYARQQRIPPRGITDILLNQIDSVRQGGRARAVRVDLRVKIVQRDHLQGRLASLCQQVARKAAPNETCPASD